MRERGATVVQCPRCGNETPVYETSYDASGEPLSFSVCLWCSGYVEYDPTRSLVRAAYEGRDRRARESA